MTKLYLFIRRYLAVFLMLTSVLTMAQERRVTGRVTASDDGGPLPGVNIQEKGTTNGTVSDAQGNFSISVGANATLVFSFIGYTPQEIVVGNQSNINVILDTDVVSLSEVVVVGYGVQDRKEITSAVSSISSEDFNRGNVTNPGQLIQGKVAGLSIVRAGGDPNQGYTIRLRGLSTFGANTEPLIVLDGVVGASLDNVDPNDIETIDVLKDGSAAAIYGARGSSGVILVTTKSGKSGRGAYTNVDYNGFVTVDQVANTITVLSPEEYVSRGGQDFGNRTNWFDELTQVGTSQTHNLSIAGASGTTTYRASVNYRDNQGIVKGVDFQRLNTRLSVGHEAMDGRLRLNANLAHNNRDQESINMGAFRYAVIYNPTAPIFEDTPAAEQWGGYFQRGLFDFYNPVALANQQTFQGNRKNTLTNYRVDYDIIDNLTVGINYALDLENGMDGAYWSKKDIQTGAGGNGIARRTTYDNYNRLFEGTLKYSTRIGENLNADFLLGAASQVREFQGFGVQVRNFLFDETKFDNIAFGSIRVGNNTDAYSYRSRDVLVSNFGRVNLNYDNTYFLSASVRSESFSGFGEDQKTGFFPAVSAGVQLTELFDLGPVSSLKLRGSFGITGNLPPSADLALATFRPGPRIDFDGDPLTPDDTFVSLVQARDPNPTLKWETKTEINVGVDYALFGGRITGSMEYYTRNIDDLLYGVQLPSGAPNPFSNLAPSNVAGFAWANVGSLQAAGFEFLAAYNNINIGPVSWTPTFNFTVYKRPVIQELGVGSINIPEIRLSTPGSPGQNNNAIIRNKPGETLGNMYGPVLSGIGEDGSYIFPDRFYDSDGALDPETFEVVGNGLPDGEFGFNNTFVYGNWDLNFFLRGVFGHNLYNSYRGFYENRDNASNTWNSVVTDKTPVVTSTPTFSSLYVEDASFIRLDNASIGYNLSNTGKAFSRVRIYAAVQNLFTITNYTGIDPEVRYTDSEIGDRFNSSLAPGLERRNTYFTTRSFTFGVNLGFK
jgi:TonB-dependent starch-binding outer membrane protein SusC